MSYKAPRFRCNGVHVFETIARQHNIRAISIDRNFKVGARSKKDPTIWVGGALGQEAMVEIACVAVLELFNTKANRVSLKVDIPQEHHFSIIGKKGENMKLLMSATGCHVHFPDSVRAKKTTATPAKHQVSITGAPDGVEDARHQIRGLLPFTISFDVPAHVAVDAVEMTPELREIAEMFGVIIFFKQRKDRQPLALVKG